MKNLLLIRTYSACLHHAQASCSQTMKEKTLASI